MKSFKFLKTRKILEKRAELDNQTLKIKSLNQAFPSVFPNRRAGYFSHKIDCALAAGKLLQLWENQLNFSSYRQSLSLFMTSENLNGLHFSFEIFIWISFFLQCSMFVVVFLPKIEIGAKYKIISRNHSSTISCKNCNWQLQSDFAIHSCSYSSYQLKKIATKSCLQLKIAIHDFLQLLVELRLLSGCKNLQCGYCFS